MIVVQDALGQYDINFLEEEYNEETDFLFEDDHMTLQSIVDGEVRNMNGTRFQTRIHLDIGSTGSFITLSHAKRIGATSLGTREVTLNTLGSSKKVLMNTYKVLFTIRDGLKESIYPVTCLSVRKIGFKNPISEDEHLRLCSAYKVPPEKVNFSSGEVHCLLGLDAMEHQARHVTHIKGRPVGGKSFPNLVLMSSKLTPKLFFVGSHFVSMKDDNDTSEVIVSRVEVKYLDCQETKHVEIEQVYQKKNNVIPPKPDGKI